MFNLVLGDWSFGSVVHISPSLLLSDVSGVVSSEDKCSSAAIGVVTVIVVAFLFVGASIDSFTRSSFCG